MATEMLKSATRDGVTLRYVEAGTGDPPLLFVHGWCCDHTYWRDQLPEFAADHRVLALDQRGHGASDKPDQDYTIGGFVEDLSWLIRELHLERPVLVGHSMGGVIGLNLVRKHPELVSALAMVDSPVIPLPPEMMPFKDNINAGLRSPGYVAIASVFVRSMFKEDGDADLRDRVVASMASVPQRLMHTAIDSLLEEENLPAGPLPVPAIYILATTNRNSAVEVAARYCGLEVVAVDSGHFVQMEKPDETNRIMAGFLEKLT